MMRAQVAQARHRGYRDAATRYDPEGGTMTRKDYEAMAAMLASHVSVSSSGASEIHVVSLPDYLKQDGLSDFDLAHMADIIRNDYGDWFHARLMRALHDLLPHADSANTARLERAYPGSVAAYRIWYNDPSMEGRSDA
jgi:hypothetical protein